MTYEKLLKEKAIEPIYASEGEIADHLRKAGHDTEIAQNVTILSDSWKPPPRKLTPIKSTSCRISEKRETKRFIR